MWRRFREWLRGMSRRAFVCYVDNLAHQLHEHLANVERRLTARFIQLEEKIMTKDELVAALDGIKTQLDKAKTEITGKIADLETALANANVVDPAVAAAVDSLKNAGQSLDDVVADPTP